MRKRSLLSLFLPALFLCALLGACNSSSKTNLIEDGDETPAEQDEVEALPDGDQDGDSESADNDGISFTLPADFFADQANDAFHLRVRGLINSSRDYEAQKATGATGQSEIILSGKSSVITESLTVHSTVIPNDYDVVEMRNKAYILVDAFTTLESSAGSTHYLMVGLGIAREALQAIKTSGQPLAKVPSYTWSNVYDVTLKQRNDGALFRKYCLRSKGDYANPEQAVFLDFRTNNSFADGENLILNVQIRLLPENVITPANEEQFCRYYQNDSTVTKEVFERESAKDGTELDCELPEGYLTSGADNAAVFSLKGPINDFNGTSSTYSSSQGVFNVKLGGQEYKVADYQVLAGRYIQMPMDVVYLHAMGTVATLNANHYSFNLLEVFASVADLIDLADTENLLQNDATSYDNASGLRFYAALSQNEEKIKGTDDYIKSCPKALTDLSKSDNSLFVCRTVSNPQYIAGEQLQMAGHFALSADKAQLQSFYKTAEDCLCTKNGTQSIPCVDFDALTTK